VQGRSRALKLRCAGPVEGIFETGLGLGLALEERLELVLDLDAQYGAHCQALSAGARIAYEF
jgi:hypothetical protein